jgi:hypothetical protein
MHGKCRPLLPDTWDITLSKARHVRWPAASTRAGCGRLTLPRCIAASACSRLCPPVMTIWSILKGGRYCAGGGAESGAGHPAAGRPPAGHRARGLARLAAGAAHRRAGGQGGADAGPLPAQPAAAEAAAADVISLQPPDVSFSRGGGQSIVGTAWAAPPFCGRFTARHATTAAPGVLPGRHSTAGTCIVCWQQVTWTCPSRVCQQA